MAHYVISDLHGDDRRFHAMLEAIGFSDADTLYILGDIFDRGDNPIGLLEEVMAAPNMIMLLGNHEYMCLQCSSPDAQEIDFRRWNRNNNRPTKAGLAARTPERREEILAFLRSLPTHLMIEVLGQKYYLVHGFPGDTIHDEVWNRPDPESPNPLPGCRVIVGHTPVSCLGRDEAEEEAYYRLLSENGQHMHIVHAPGFIDIDCGCGYPEIPGALACMRLEDGAEFYIPRLPSNGDPIV